MFDTFMRNTMPVWLLVSILYPVFVAAFLFRAAARFRRLKALRGRVLALQAKTQAAWSEARARDWVPTP